MNILDFILIAIFIACIVNGYFKGFFKEIFDIISFIIGLLLFSLIYPMINKWLLQSSFLEKVKTWVIHDLKLADFVVNTQEDIILGIQNLNVPQIIKNLLIENNNEVFYNMFNTNNVVEYIAKFISIIIIGLITIFIVIILVNILITILSKSTKFLSKLPILGKFDKIGGIGLGILNGIFTILIISMIILVLSLFPQLSFLKNQLDGFVTNTLINDNILIKALLKLILGIIN